MFEQAIKTFKSTCWIFVIILSLLSIGFYLGGKSPRDVYVQCESSSGKTITQQAPALVITVPNSPTNVLALVDRIDRDSTIPVAGQSCLVRAKNLF